MGKSCAVPGCTNYTGHAPPGTTWHVFPMDTRIRKVWIQKIKRDEGPRFKVTQHTNVCSQHFAKADFMVNRFSKIRRLKPTAVPTIFTWSKKPTDQETNRAKRAADRLLRFPKTGLSFQDSFTEEVPTDHTSMTDERETEAATSLLQLASQVASCVPQPSEESKKLARCQEENDKLQKLLSDCKNEIMSLKRVIEEQKNECIGHQLKVAKLNSQVLSYESIRHDNSLILFYTGLPNALTFDVLFDRLKFKATRLNYWRGAKTPENKQNTSVSFSAITDKQKFFLLLLRLKQGLSVIDLARIFGISKSTVSRIFTTWVTFVFLELSTIFKIPSVESIKSTNPPEFCEYPDTTLIIDCTEIKIQRPLTLTAQQKTFSSYKHCNTFKFLIGILPIGITVFVSELFGGSASDKYIVKQSKLLEMLPPGHNIMADKGFDLDELLPPGIKLNVPPKFYKTRGPQMSEHDVAETRSIAKVRVHVERAIGRIKTYNILHGALPIALHDVADQIVGSCAYLTNFKPPLIQKKKNIDHFTCPEDED